VKQPAALTSAKGDQKPTPLFHGKQATDDVAAALFHVTQSCDPAQLRFGPMSAKTFHVKQSAALTSAKGDQNPMPLFHGKQATDDVAAALFHVTQLSEPAQHRLGLRSEP
jgi:hypothetical protein